MPTHIQEGKSSTAKVSSGEAAGRESGPSRRISWVPLLAMALVGLSMLYFLSLGPVVWVVHRFDLEPMYPYLEGFYAPLGWLHENTPLQGPIEWYVGLFEG